MNARSDASPAQALALRRALGADPGNGLFRAGLMELCLGQGRLEEARALGEADPSGDAGVRSVLALVLAEQGAADPLLDLLASRSDEDIPGAVLEAGTRALLAGRWETALAALDHGLARAPWAWPLHLARCKVLAHAHRLEEASARAAWLAGQEAADPGIRGQAGFLAGEGLLLRGRLEEGLPWLESRFAMDGGPRPETLPFEPWLGQDLAGRTLLIQAEQGFGDLFMMARYVGILAARGARVLLSPLRGAEGVLATCDGLAGLVAGTVDLPRDTLQVPAMSLPLRCGTRLSTIPAPVPYLHVPGEVPHRQAIDACLAGARGRRILGLVWAGNPTHARDRQRSLDPEILEVLGDVPGVVWADLVVRPGPRPGLELLDLASHLSDFSDTAYALSRMDGLISVDSGTAHLAGALGRPVGMLLPWLPDWRWMMDRTDSPWYPTMELWRQPAQGDWPALLGQVRNRLLVGAWPGRPSG